MKRLLLISNSTQHGSGYLEHCLDEIRGVLGDARTLLFLPFALHDHAAYAAKVREAFAPLGVDVRGGHEVATGETALSGCDAVFAGGGNTFRLLRALWERDLVEPLRAAVGAGMPWIGTSAGSNVACATIQATNDMPIVPVPTLEALALVPFVLNPHYLDPDPSSTHEGETREQRIRELLEESDVTVVGLREGGMLRVEGERMTLRGVGGARVFRRGRDPEELAPGADASMLLRA